MSRKNHNPLGLPSRKDALEMIRSQDFIMSNGKSEVELDSELAMEEEE